MSDGPLIEEITPLDHLRAEYINNDNKLFVKQIDYLWRQGFQIRRTKGNRITFTLGKPSTEACTGDGSCFYRCEASLDA